MRGVYYFILGAVLAAIIFKGTEQWRPDIVTQERSALLTKNHVWCYQDVLLKHCINDTIFINFDSLYEIYQVSCGIRIDSIIDGEIQ